MVIRWQFVDFQSGDYRAFLDRWYAYLAENGGFAALQGQLFSNYNTPYLALLAITTYLPVPEIVAIKAISVIFDVAARRIRLQDHRARSGRQRDGCRRSPSAR